MKKNESTSKIVWTIIILLIFIVVLGFILFMNLSEPTIEPDFYCDDCNIILLSVDTFRGDHLPCYGYERNTGPNICSLAENGVLFENYIVHNYLTPFNMMSVMTSRYPSNTGLLSLDSATSPTDISLVGILKENNYTTAAFGSSFEVMVNTRLIKGSEDKIPVSEYFSKNFDTFVYTGHRNIPTDSISWLQDNNEEKFFLWLEFGSVHWPYPLIGEPEEKRRFDPKGYDGIFKDMEVITRETIYRVYNDSYYYPNGTKVPLTKEDREYIISRYDFTIYQADQFIGDLLKQIEELNLSENTMIIFHGIHGEDLGEHGYYTHYNIYDTEVKNPLIIYNPKAKLSKRIISQVRGIDLTPTVLDIVGANLAPEFEGISLISTIKHDNLSVEAYLERVPLWEDTAFAPDERYYNQTIYYGDNGIRVNGWKLIHRRNWEFEEKESLWARLIGSDLELDEFELYNLETDPFEQVNVIEKYPDKFLELKEDLLRWEEENVRYKQKH